MWGNPPFRNDARAKPSRRLEIQVRNLDAERDGSSAPSGLTKVSNNMDSLLRLFRSDFFDAFMAVTYLYRYRDTRGVHDYLCNELYVLADADLEVFMPQVCNLLVHHCPDSPGLERFVMDKCASSMHFSVQVYWFLQAAVEDAIREKDRNTEERCRYLRTQCETAAVNGSQYSFRPSLSRRLHSSTSDTSSVGKKTASSVKAVMGSDAPVEDKSDLVPSVDQPSTEKSEAESSIPVVEEDLDLVPVPVMDSADLNVAEEFAGDGAEEDDAEEDDFVDAPLEIPDNPDSNSAVVDVKEEEHDGSDLNSDRPTESNLGSNAKESEVVFQNKTMEGEVDTNLGNGEGDATHPEKTQSSPESVAQGLKNVDLNADEKENAFDQLNGSGGHGASLNVTARTKGGAYAPLENNDLSNDVEGSTDSKDATTEANEMPETHRPSVEASKDSRVVKPPMAQVTNSVEALDVDAMQMVRMKQERFDYFQDSLAIVKLLVQLSLSTRDQAETGRHSHLVGGLHKVNGMLFRRMCGESAEPLVRGAPAPKAEDVVALGRSAALRSIHLPLTRADVQVLRILRVLPEESVILTSRTRCPYLLYVEVLPSAMTCSDRYVFCEHMGIGHTPDPQASRRHSSSREPKVNKIWNSSSAEEIPNSEDITSAPLNENGSMKRSRRKFSEMTPRERQRANVRATIYGDAYTDQPDNFAKADRDDLTGGVDDVERKSRQAALLGVFGELWEWKEERLLKKSPFADLKDSKLMSFIIKAGDDLRQEQLAIQLIKQFDQIFKEEDVDLFLKPFTVMSVCSDAGLVEVMPDSVSIHSLKGRTPNFRSLLDYFERAYGKVGTASFRAAQRRFIRSMAGYSLVCYFLQIKDRHNGNIMIDARGHIVHIDFGFMLTNSPGAIKFENAPFKLTEEYLQVICAMKNVQDVGEISKSEGFRFFQELFVLGLLAAQKHCEKITTLVDIMMEGTSMPCMTGGSSIIEGLQQRFALGMPEKQTISHAISLIESSRLSVRSVGYDRFQAYSNGYR